MGRGAANSLLVGRGGRERSNLISPEERIRNNRVARYLRDLQERGMGGGKLIYEVPSLHAFFPGGESTREDSARLTEFSDRVCDEYVVNEKNMSHMVSKTLSEEQAEEVMRYALDSVADSNSIHFFHLPFRGKPDKHYRITIATR